METPMRRFRQQLPDAEVWRILAASPCGVLATVDSDGWPYGVPLNHVVIGNRLYFHAAMEGHKLRNIAHSDKACYTVVGEAEVIPSRFVTKYRSVICFGRIHPVLDRDRKTEILLALAERFAPGETQTLEKEMRLLDKTCVLEMTVDAATGKYHNGQ